MYKKTFALIAILAISVMTFVAPALGAFDDSWWYKPDGGNYIKPNDDAEICASSDRCAKIWLDDFDTTLSTIGAIAAGAITITVDNANALLVETAGGTDVFNVDTVTPLAIFSALVNLEQGAEVADVTDLFFGTSSDASMRYSTAQAADALLFGTSLDSNNIVIVENADRGFDFAHPLQTNPTQFIHSANQATDEWLSITHDQTDGVIDVGTGNVSFPGTLQTGQFTFEEDAGFPTWADMSVSATPTAGDQMSYVAKIDGNNFLKIYSEADGSGGIQNEEVRVFEELHTYSAQKGNVTTVAAATYDLLVDDYILHVTYTTTGAVTSLTLPTAQCDGSEDDGRVITVKDAGGNSNTNNVTVDTQGSETIDGAVTPLVLDVDYVSYDLYCENSNWFVY